MNIKVDREERPDVDRVYMTFVQATTGSGGWPMSVWLTPDLKPFVGGTYFPPEDRYGQPGFPESAATNRGRLANRTAKKSSEQGTKIVAALAQRSSRAVKRAAQLGAAILEARLSAIRAQFRCARRRFRRRAEVSAAGDAEFSLPRLRARRANQPAASTRSK